MHPTAKPARPPSQATQASADELLLSEEATNVPVDLFRTGDFVEARPGIAGGGEEAIAVGVVVRAVVAADGLELTDRSIYFYGNPDAFVLADVYNGISDGVLVKTGVTDALGNINAVTLSPRRAAIRAFSVDDDDGRSRDIFQEETHFLQPSANERLGLLRREVSGEGVKAFVIKRRGKIITVVTEAIRYDVTGFVVVPTAGVGEEGEGEEYE